MLHCGYELGGHRRDIRDVKVSDGLEESGSGLRGWKAGCAEQFGQFGCASRERYSSFCEHADQLTGEFGGVIRADGLKGFSQVGRRVGQIVNADHGVADEA